MSLSRFLAIDIFKINYKNEKSGGVFGALMGIIREEGPWKLCGIHFGLRDFLRRTLSNNEKLSVWRAVSLGVGMGTIDHFFYMPSGNLIKSCVPINGGKNPQITELIKIFSVKIALRELYRTGGFRSIWRTIIPSIQSAVLRNLGDLTAYDMLKKAFCNKTNFKEGLPLHASSAVIAGGISALCHAPVAVIQSRFRKQPMDENGRGLWYKDSFDCCVQIIRNEGYAALYRGFIPHWCRLGPWTLMFWLTYEQIDTLIKCSKS